MYENAVNANRPGSGTAAAGPNAGRDRVLAIRCFRSPPSSLIEDENVRWGSSTPSRRARTHALPNQWRYTILMLPLVGSGRSPWSASLCGRHLRQ
jgi:hypothetical protein